MGESLNEALARSPELRHRFDLEQAQLALKARCDIALAVEGDPKVLDNIARFIEQTVKV